MGQQGSAKVNVKKMLLVFLEVLIEFKIIVTLCVCIFTQNRVTPYLCSASRGMLALQN